jgi:hypothetical protein
MLSHPPFDLRPFPPNVPASVRTATQVAARVRSSFAMTAIESLLAMEFSGPDSFDDHVARAFIAERFGNEGLKQYLDLVPEAATLMPDIEAGAWKTSPLSTGLYLKNIIPGGEEFIYGQHLRLMSNAIVKALLGKGKRFLAFAMPYRHGKSILNSVVTAIWFLANFPHLRVGLTAHSDALSTRFARWVREAIRENSGRLGFGLAEDHQSMHEFSTTAGGELWQRSIAGSIQGLGTDVLLVDDPFGSPKDAESIKSRDDAWNWFFGALSRVENEGIVILCTTRWWGDDLYGRLQAGYADTDSSQWEFISLPAIATEEGDAVGRKKGEALWPGKRMLEELQILERTMPLADWARGYQQIILEDLGIGRCYPDYDPVACLQPGEWDYESAIHVGIDFNADPMSGEIFMVSKVPLPGWTNQFETVARGLDEVIVETTEMSVFAEALMGRLKEIAGGFRMHVTMHYDQTSNRKVVGLREGDTAVSILKREVARCKSSLIAVSWRDIGSNPGVFKRVDTVNSMLKRRDLKVDPKQQELAKDFKFVCWKLDKANRRVTIDKARDPARSHASDAAGYALVGTLASPYGEQPFSLPWLR